VKQTHKFFGGDQLTKSFPGKDLDARIRSAVRYMATKGASRAEEIDEAVAQDTSRELSREIASRTLDYLCSEGIDIRRGRIMDLGAGLGMLSEEAAVRGGNPVAIEPGIGFREIALERIQRGGRGMVIAAAGENLPFRDNSFDVVISLEMLEHVESPAAVLQEVYRILRPGGWFYLTCPNYLSFREPHYSVAWFPLLPKPVGSLYLRLRGRPTEFLRTSITYTTLPWIRRRLKKLGLRSVRERQISVLCRSPALIKNHWKRALVQAAWRFMPTGVLSRAIDWFDQTTHMCTPSICELVQKPPAEQN
jgi:2-polyprenyl-3-methyl-5-hydroxy-6-metoxy-1,4-benzoquinol methylase